MPRTIAPLAGLHSTDLGPEEARGTNSNKRWYRRVGDDTICLKSLQSKPIPISHPLFQCITAGFLLWSIDRLVAAAQVNTGKGSAEQVNYYCYIIPIRLN